MRRNIECAAKCQDASRNVDICKMLTRCLGSLNYEFQYSEQDIVRENDIYLAQSLIILSSIKTSILFDKMNLGLPLTTMWCIGSLTV